MADLYDIKKLDGVTFEMNMGPDAPGCLKCMDGTFTGCGTMGKMQGTMKVIDDNTVHFTKMTFCGCCRASPVPCFMCCGYGPLAALPKAYREPGTNKWVGKGQVCAGGCCPCVVNGMSNFAIPFAHLLTSSLPVPDDICPADL